MTVGAVGVGFVGLGASPASATTVWQGRGSPFGRVLVPDPLRYCGLRALFSTWNYRSFNVGIDAPVGANHDTTTCRDVVHGFGTRNVDREINWAQACEMTHRFSKAYASGGWWYCRSPRVVGDCAPCEWVTDVLRPRRIGLARR